LFLTEMSESGTKKTDSELARAAAEGGRAEFEEIVRRYCTPLTRFAIGRTGTVQDAEDIVQETFLRAYQNLGSFDGSYSLRNWLFTIAYRLIVSDFRKKRPKRLSSQAATWLEADRVDPQQNQWIWQAAGKLGGEAFTALWLRYKQGMKIREIADVMKRTKTGVRVLLHRARKRLARDIAARNEFLGHSQCTASRRK
jgi:RNA polymerase sigma-70 factor (ECF subfamily)